MRFPRLGQDLWQEWSGWEYPSLLDDEPLIYVIETHIDFEDEAVRRSLAYALQREGVYTSVSEALESFEDAQAVTGYAVHLDGESELTFYDSEYFAWTGHEMDEPIEITWVEIPSGS